MTRSQSKNTIRKFEPQQEWFQEFLDSPDREQRFPWYEEYRDICEKHRFEGQAAAQRGERLVDPRPAEFVYEDDVWRLLKGYLEEPGLRQLVEESVDTEYTPLQAHILYAYAYWFAYSLPYYPVGSRSGNGAFGGMPRTAAGVVSGYFEGLDDPKLINRLYSNRRSTMRRLSERSEEARENYIKQGRGDPDEP